MFNGAILINCLDYIDLNLVKAGICTVPEDHRWYYLGYHARSGNKDGFLSLDFGLKDFWVNNDIQRLHYYRKFVYEKEAGIEPDVLDRERKKGFAVDIKDRLPCPLLSGILGIFAPRPRAIGHL
jgi:putative transposase